MMTGGWVKGGIIYRGLEAKVCRRKLYNYNGLLAGLNG